MSSRDFSSPAARHAWQQDILRPLDEEGWDLRIRELFVWQFHRVLPYRRLCEAHGITPDTLRDWRHLPAVPQQLFKLEKLFTHGDATPDAVYETSGTTTGQPGRQHLLHTDIYEAASVAGAQRLGLFAWIRHLHFLAPSPEEAPHSSLSAMFGYWGKQKEGARFWTQANAIDFTALRDTLTAQAATRVPMGIAGTAFAFVHLLDAWADLPPIRLPRNSWLLETGGFKGRSREVAKPELYTALARTFGLRDIEIYNEYGMSELSSQAYTNGTRGAHALPPWARVLVVDPATGREVPQGRRGLVRWFDLANVDSVLALQTLDLAERTPAGFRLLGRLPRTEPRGCSLSAEDLLVRR